MTPGASRQSSAWRASPPPALGGAEPPCAAPCRVRRVSPEEQRIIELVPDPPRTIILLGRSGTGERRRQPGARGGSATTAWPCVARAHSRSSRAHPACSSSASPAAAPQARPPALCSACGPAGSLPGTRARCSIRSLSPPPPRSRSRHVGTEASCLPVSWAEQIRPLCCRCSGNETAMPRRCHGDACRPQLSCSLARQPICRRLLPLPPACPPQVARSFGKLRAAIVPEMADVFAEAAAKELHSLKAVPDEAFPLFLSSRQFLRLLDGERPGRERACGLQRAAGSRRLRVPLPAERLPELVMSCGRAWACPSRPCMPMHPAAALPPTHRRHHRAPFLPAPRRRQHRVGAVRGRGLRPRCRRRRRCCCCKLALACAGACGGMLGTPWSRCRHAVLRCAALRLQTA